MHHRLTVMFTILRILALGVIALSLFNYTRLEVGSRLAIGMLTGLGAVAASLAIVEFGRLLVYVRNRFRASSLR